VQTFFSFFSSLTQVPKGQNQLYKRNSPKTVSRELNRLQQLKNSKKTVDQNASFASQRKQCGVRSAIPTAAGRGGKPTLL
jgi:hypothetical protein